MMEEGEDRFTDLGEEKGDEGVVSTICYYVCIALL